LQVDEGGLRHEARTEREEATELFTRHAAGIYRYCLRRLGSPEEAEDAVQVTYLNAWRSLKAGCEPKERRAWLFQIAANVCASALRSKLGGTRLELRDPSALDELFAVEDPESDQLVGLSEALRELPSRQRRALVLRDWRGLSYDEIAAEMAVSDSAVETLLFRARNKVAATLANAEWRRKLAPSARALLVWPFALVRTKSAASTGAGHLKLSLVLAGGTVAPLVAFGLFQALLGPEQAAQANRGPTISQSAPDAAVPWLQDGPLPHASRVPAGNGTKRIRRPDEPRRQHRSAHGIKHSSAHARSTAGASPATSQASKIVLCHATPSDKRPGVTIDVSTHALRGLGDDARQACD
jgi:RNA polymerase sigma-70 factor, ECF subfamily